MNRRWPATLHVPPYLLRCCAGFRLKFANPDAIFSTTFPSRSRTVPIAELSGLDTADVGLDDTKCGLDTLMPDFVRCITSRFFRARDSSEMSPARSCEPCSDDDDDRATASSLPMNPEDDVSAVVFSAPSGGPPDVSTVEVVCRGFGFVADRRSGIQFVNILTLVSRDSSPSATHNHRYSSSPRPDPWIDISKVSERAHASAIV